MTAQQAYFTNLKLALEAGGLAVYDDRLPPEPPAFPIVYLSDTLVDPMLVKAQEAGYITQTVEVWGQASRRGLVSDTIEQVLDIAKTVTDDIYAFSLQSDSEFQITADNSTRTPLMQGSLTLRVFYNRR